MLAEERYGRPGPRVPTARALRYQQKRASTRRSGGGHLKFSTPTAMPRSRLRNTVHARAPISPRRTKRRRRPMAKIKAPNCRDWRDSTTPKPITDRGGPSEARTARQGAARTPSSAENRVVIHPRSWIHVMIGNDGTLAYRRGGDARHASHWLTRRATMWATTFGVGRPVGDPVRFPDSDQRGAYGAKPLRFVDGLRPAAALRPATLAPHSVPRTRASRGCPPGYPRARSGTARPKGFLR